MYINTYISILLEGTEDLIDEVLDMLLTQLLPRAYDALQI
jgi:hypothetical protein